MLTFPTNFRQGRLALVGTWDPHDNSEMRCGYDFERTLRDISFSRSRVRVTGNAVLLCDSQEFTRFISFQKGGLQTQRCEASVADVRT